MRRVEGETIAAIAIAGAVVALGACAVFESQVDRAASAGARAVNAYCQNFTADQREQFGDRVRELASPDAVTVECQ